MGGFVNLAHFTTFYDILAKFYFIIIQLPALLLYCQSIAIDKNTTKKVH